MSRAELAFEILEKEWVKRAEKIAAGGQIITEDLLVFAVLHVHRNMATKEDVAMLKSDIAALKSTVDTMKWIMSVGFTLLGLLMAILRFAL